MIENYKGWVISLTWEDNHSYIDAIVHLCEKNNIEIEDIKKYISPAIKDHLEAEGMSLNLLPKGNTLF